MSQQNNNLPIRPKLGEELWVMNLQDRTPRQIKILPISKGAELTKEDYMLDSNGYLIWLITPDRKLKRHFFGKTKEEMYENLDRFLPVWNETETKFLEQLDKMPERGYNTYWKEWSREELRLINDYVFGRKPR